MPEDGQGFFDGPRDRRGFPRLSITESIKLQVIDSPAGSPATFGSTVDISRGGLEAVVQGAPIPMRARCIVRFLATNRIKPVMSWGVVVATRDTSAGRHVRVEFETPLEVLQLTPRTVKPETRGTRILVVDDDYHTRDVVERYLVEQGYAVTSVMDGRAALEVMQRSVPNAVILDIYMPRLNGLEVLELMHEHLLEPDVVLTISGVADHNSARRSLELGADDFLVKPIDLRYLAWALRLRL